MNNFIEKSRREGLIDRLRRTTGIDHDLEHPHIPTEWERKVMNWRVAHFGTDMEVVPCKICGEPTPNIGDKLCDGCWEVEHRLNDFIRHENGRQLVKKLLDKYECT